MMLYRGRRSPRSAKITDATERQVIGVAITNSRFSSRMDLLQEGGDGGFLGTQAAFSSVVLWTWCRPLVSLCCCATAKGINMQKVVMLATGDG